MALDSFHGIITLILVVAFIGLCFWVFLPSKKRGFEEDANLPFDDDHPRSNKRESNNE